MKELFLKTFQKLKSLWIQSIEEAIASATETRTRVEDDTQGLPTELIVTPRHLDRLTKMSNENVVVIMQTTT